ncbi:MAG: OmpA family protein [Deltaproteobacteria bacterium]|jgi:OOP family OmpA-OmpF porin|nr:OmpA family protein [Deltaproteobacteria bacterium]
MMKRNSFWTVLLFGLLALLLAACATTKPLAPFNAVDLNPMLTSGDYVLKANNFAVILDKSGSMGEKYKGKQKLDCARDLASAFNHTVPNANLTGALRMFGKKANVQPAGTDLLWGPATQNAAALDAGLNQVGFSNGDSPLNLALDATAQDFKSAQGNIAVVIFTDANKEVMNYAAVKKSVMNLKSQFGDRICIYPVQIGADKEAAKFLAQVAADSGCGFMVKGDDIASGKGMADFVANVFLQKAPEVVEVICVDDDGDLVCAELDKCPGTPKGARVNKFGCWVLGDVLFDFDKSNIKPQYYRFLDDAAKVFEMNPSIKVEVQGNTDNIGTAKYNMGLSLRRANAVMQYLINKGVAQSRLNARGFGFSRPVATNDTDEGRALNRRVELTPMP